MTEPVTLELIEPDKPTSTALVERHATPVADYMLQVLLERGASLEEMREALALRREMKAELAREACHAAFAAFKSEAIAVIRNKAMTGGPLNGKKYADLFSVVQAVTPALSKHGLSLSWSLSKDEKEWIEVTCTLKHALGHSDSVSMGGPPDVGGAKNAIQARASTITFLERYTAKAILGVAEQDDDNNGADGAKDADPLEIWAGRAALAADLDELRRVSKDGARLFKGAANVQTYSAFAAAVQARGVALRAEQAKDPFVKAMEAEEKKEQKNA